MNIPLTACKQYCLAVSKLRDNTGLRSPARKTLAVMLRMPIKKDRS